MPRLSKEEMMKRFAADVSEAENAKKEAALNISDEVVESKTKEFMAQGETEAKATEKAYAVAENVEQGLLNQKARVVLVLDRSGSMEDEYDQGLLNGIASKSVATGLQFDDDGEVEVYLFANNAKKLPQTMNTSNFFEYIDTVVHAKNPGMFGSYVHQFGGTEYAPIINLLVTDYGGTKGSVQDIPTFVIFITDGENSDQSAAKSAITKAADYPIFFQFIGVDSKHKGGGLMSEAEAHSSFPFLSQLDDLEGRTYDNADFFAVKGFEAFDKPAILMAMMNEFPGWLNAVRGKLIK